MFDSVLDLEELILDEQRNDMFGIFERKPSLLGTMATGGRNVGRVQKVIHQRRNA